MRSWSASTIGRSTVPRRTGTGWGMPGPHRNKVHASWGRCRQPAPPRKAGRLDLRRGSVRGLR